MRPYDLRCEYRVNPLGIDVPEPRFFWKLRAPQQRGVRQSAYRLQVALSATFDTPLWDSGVVNTGRSIQVVYGGETLRPRTHYHWRVQAWDSEGRSDGWSEPAWLETGLMQEGWRARWIGMDASTGQCVSPLLRREFLVTGAVRSARLYATAHGCYKLWLNGQPVGDSLLAPGWTVYAKRLQYQVYDVTDLIGPDGNAIGAMLGNGWYRSELGWVGQDTARRKPRELLAQLVVTYADGHEQIIATGSDWKGMDGPIRYSEIYHGEHVDSRCAVDGWCTYGLDDSGWHDVLVGDGGTTNVVAQDGLPMRVTEERRPLALLTTPKGERVVDLGQNMVGYLRVRVNGQSGDRVVLRYFEVLDQQGNVYLDNLRKARQTDEFTLRGGEEVLEPTFTFHGFQYVQIVEYPGEPNLEDMTGMVVHSDMERTGDFACNDEMINHLQRNIVWGQRGNFVDVPTDCPQRDERLGWTGDAQVFISTAAFNYDTAAFYTKWLRDMAADQLPTGGIPHVIPAVIEGDSSAAWADAATICPWTMVEYYDDTRLLAECYPMMKNWVEYIRAQGDDEELWNTGFHFGDWLGLDAGSDSYVGATSQDLIATAYYALSTRLVAQAAETLGYEDDAEVYGKLYKRVRKAFRREFVTPNGRLACPTQTAQVVGLHFDLLDKDSRKRALRTLKDLLAERDGHLSTGFVGTPYLCHALTDNGAHEEACALVLKKDYPSWLYPITKGATTMWEHWDNIKPDGSFWSADMNSFNHYAYGSIGDWLYRNILGIAPDASQPGFRNVLVAPLPNEHFTEARGSLRTLYGQVSVSWRVADGRMALKLTVPENSTATVTLPGAARGDVREGGVPLMDAEGIADVERVSGGVRFTAGSGSYQFEYRVRE